MLDSGKVNVLMDLSYGSSAKGQTSAYIAQQFLPEVLISTNRSNASHTVYNDKEGFVFKVLPTAAAICRWDNSYEPHVFIGSTASFTIEQLIEEIKWCGIPKEQVFIHPRAMVNQQKHSDMEAGESGTKHLGSTMSGAGAVYAEKVMRGKDVELAFHFKEELDEYCTVFEDEEAFLFTTILAGLLDSGCTALAELSQGFPLSIDHGQQYKYATSRNVVPAQILSDLGLRPDYMGTTIANIRSYPIRVSNRFNIDELVLLVDNPKNPLEQILMHADQLGFTYNQMNALITDLWIEGNTRLVYSPIYGKEVVVHKIESGVQGWSGPCESDMTEIDWQTMSLMAGMEDESYHELTTLTKLPRRIFKIDDGSISKELLKKFKIACGDQPIVSLTFLNYVDYNTNEITSPEQITPKVRAFIDQANEDLEEIFGSNVQVNIVQFGKEMKHIFEL